MKRREFKKTMIVIPVWGDKFVELFTDLVLPNVLAQEVPNPDRYLLMIGTHKDHEKTLNATVKKSRFPYSVTTIEQYDERPHWTLNRHHRAAIETAINLNMSCLFWQPDCLLNAVALEKIETAARSGIDMVCVNSLRTQTETAYPRLKALGPRIVSVDLVDTWLRNMHPLSIGQFFNSKPFTTMPNTLYRATEKEIEFYSSAWHPLFIYDPLWPETDLNTETIDGSYVRKHIDRGDKVRYVKDNSIVQLSLTGSDCHNHWLYQENIAILPDRLAYLRGMLHREHEAILQVMNEPGTLRRRGNIPEDLRLTIGQQDWIDWKTFKSELACAIRS